MTFKKFLDNFENYVCRILLSCFVTLLFIQIISREIFSNSIYWIEELSVFMFVWFAYFGASYAVRIGAHNRVTFQFGFLPKKAVQYITMFADLIWIAFNTIFIYYSYDFVFYKMNKFWEAQTLGIPMKWIYIVLPITFTLMTIRIIQVNYLTITGKEVIEAPSDVDTSNITKKD